MPTYSYECAKCGSITDEFHGMSATPKVACAECGSKRTKKLLGTGSGIIFKGSGFYETDYKDKKGKKPATPSTGGDSKSDSKSESKSEKKTESKKSDTKKKAPAA